MEKKQKTFYMYPIGAQGVGWGEEINRKEEAFENIKRSLQNI